ncbi:MAG: hypothetical protein DRH34_08910, partial [Deltaproteobacteria bacterium]
LEGQPTARLVSRLVYGDAGILKNFQIVDDTKSNLEQFFRRGLPTFRASYIGKRKILWTIPVTQTPKKMKTPHITFGIGRSFLICHGDR